MKDGGCTWTGVIADTNAPEEDHWWPIMSGEVPIPDHIPKEEAKMLVKPDNWNFYTQPAGMLEIKDEEGTITDYVLNKNAENAKNMRADYYPNIVQGKTKSWIDVYVIALGVSKMVNPFMPIADAMLPKKYQRAGLPVYIGLDFGSPLEVAQKVRGRWLILRDSSL